MRLKIRNDIRMAQLQVKKVSWWHENLIEWLIMFPEKKLADAARFFNVSQAWLSVVKNSDAFRELYEQRREAHFDNVSVSTTQKLEALAEISIEELTTRIETKPEEVSIGGLQDTTNMALKALGFGGHKPTGGDKEGVHAHFHFGSPEDKQALQVARGKMIEAGRPEDNETIPLDITPIKEMAANGNGKSDKSEGNTETQ